MPIGTGPDKSYPPLEGVAAQQPGGELISSRVLDGGTARLAAFFYALLGYSLPFDFQLRS